MKVSPEEHLPRFALDDNEHVCWIATYVAAGRWQEINMLLEGLSPSHARVSAVTGGARITRYHLLSAPDRPRTSCVRSLWFRP